MYSPVLDFAEHSFQLLKMEILEYTEVSLALEPLFTQGLASAGGSFFPDPGMCWDRPH